MKKPQVLFCKLKNRMLSDLNILQKLVFFKHFFARKLPILVKWWAFGFLSWLRRENPCFFTPSFSFNKAYVLYSKASKARITHFSSNKAYAFHLKAWKPCITSKKVKPYEFTFRKLKKPKPRDLKINFGYKLRNAWNIRFFAQCSNQKVLDFWACKKWIRTVLAFLSLQKS